MSDLTETQVDCPYCGESIGILVDPSEVGDEYTEDCQVCCQPIVMRSDPMNGSVAVRREDETTF
ncbi:MAG: CPXCG motif-containing cysteine-rich protein [Pseudomonadales bacterium]|nr:CPXCG motif-containing cysteine-rich protein [Pseudomonadales bacterium]